MFSSQPLNSGMPTGKKYMGWWGDMGGPKQRGITQYAISSNQTPAMKGALHQYIFYGYKRIMNKVPVWAPLIAAAYGILAWSNSRNHYLNSKAGHREMGEHAE